MDSTIRIWKLKLPLVGEFTGSHEQIPYQPVQLFDLPADAYVISVRCREEAPNVPVLDVWFACTPTADRTFPTALKVYATGEPMLSAPFRHLGTTFYNMHGRELVFHVFEVDQHCPVSTFGA